MILANKLIKVVNPLLFQVLEVDFNVLDLENVLDVLKKSFGVRKLAPIPGVRVRIVERLDMLTRQAN